MKAHASVLSLLLLSVALPACNCRGSGPELDSGPGTDVPRTDTGNTDAGPMPTDAGRDAPTDAGMSDTPPDAPSSRLCLSRPPGSQPFRPPPGTEEVLAESSFCVLFDGGRIRFLGLDTGRLADGPPVRDAESYGNASLGWAGASLYACSSGFDGRIVRVTIDDGSSVDLGGTCGAVTTYEGGLLVMPSIGSGRSALFGYADEGHAVAATADETFSISHSGSRMGAHADRAVLAWHSTPMVELANLTPGPGTTTPVMLEGFDDWIDGIDVLDDGRIVLLTRGASLAEEVRMFDSTGRFLRSLTPTGLGLPNGMACATGAAPLPIPEGMAHRPVGPPPAGTCASLETYGDTLDNAHGLSMSNDSCFDMGSPSNYVSYCDQVDLTASRELHVVSLYEASYPPGAPRGHWECSPSDPTDCTYIPESVNGSARITVRARPVPIVLALIAYHATDWTITVEPGAMIDSVIVADYPGDTLTSTVTGLPASVTVETTTAGDDPGVCGIAYGWEAVHNTGGGDYRALIASLRARTGLVETTFQGCYAGESFTVPHVGR